MHIIHHPIFVALSTVIACLGSWTALDLFRRVRAHVGVWRGAWLLASAVAMGLSIWAMHFIAMLGFNPGAEVRYDVALTLLSLLLAIAATAVAFFTATQNNLPRVLASGIGMGAGICIMHYVGMAAVITEFTLKNDITYVVLAFLVAVTASTGALIAALRERTLAQRGLAAIVLGFAIVGMHYTAMFGVSLVPDGSTAEVQSGVDTITLAFGVAGGTFFILFLSLIAALSDRRFEALAAQEASRSEQQLRAIIEHLPLGVFVAAAPSGEIRFANAEASKLLGHPIGAAPIWSHRERYGAIHSDGRRLAPEEHALYQAMQGGKRVGPRLQAYRRRDDAIVQFEIVAAPIPDREGGSALAVVAFQDVTEKLRADEEIRRALAEKAEAQAALIHSQRLESLGRLTGGVAHDFNNLLTVVIGALDIILRHPENAERRMRLGEAALAAARRGGRLTAQLLAFARRQPLHPEACDLNELLRIGEPLIRRAVGAERLLDLRLCDTPAVALIDPAQFEAALLNLIANAVDATAESGRISLQTCLCDLSANEFPNLTSGRFFCLRITDDGQGMSPQVMSRIFEPFFTTKPAGKGTGLGLSQVYGFVRQSDGEVHVQSKEGAGTTFTVYLPVVDQEAQASQSRTPVQRYSGKRLRILLTEDDVSVGAITETMLKNLGHEVTRAENAEQALQILRSQQEVDLLLSDIVMPGGMNGVELAHQAVAIRPGLQILLISGYAGESIDKALAEGAWPFLKKPYLEEELAAQLQRFSKEEQEGSG
jgi:PAS domain S-box-containing protein